MKFAGILALTGIALIAPGCVPEPTSSLQLPLVEPTTEDQPDASDRLKFASVAIATHSSAKASQAQWPMMFGPNRNSRIDEQVNPLWSSEGPTLVWQTEVGTGYSSPVAANGKVVFSHRVDDVERFQCHDVENGEMLWVFEQPTEVFCKFEYSDGPYSTPLIDVERDRVFVVGGQGRMSCLSFQTGQPIWTRDLHQDHELEPNLFPVGASPALDAQTIDGQLQLIFNLGDVDGQAGVVSLDAATGMERWRVTDHGAGYTTPLIATLHDQRFVFTFTADGVCSVNPDTGVLDWEFSYFSRAPDSFNAVSPILHEDKVLIVTGPGPGAICIRILPDRSFKPVWRDRRVIDCQYNPLMHSGDHVFSFTSAGQGGAELRCVEFATGKLAWRYHSKLRRGTGLIADRALLLLGEDGHLASLKATSDEPQVLSFTQSPLMAKPCYCSPAVLGQTLILKDEKRVAAFDLGSIP